MDARSLFVEQEQAAYASFQRKRVQYAAVPSRYRGCTLQLDQPTASQESIILVLDALLEGELCTDGNPLRPSQGLYIHGPVGTGKTHLLAAYANALYGLLSEEERCRQSFIDEKVREIFRKARDNALPELVREDKRFKDSLSGYSDSKIKDRDFMSYIRSSCEETHKKNVAVIMGIGSVGFHVGVEALRRSVEGKYLYSITDLVFLGFEELLRLYEEDQNMLDDVVAAPIVCIDDIHPKNEEGRAKIIQEVLERRYDQGNGATFVTSNLSPEDLVTVGAYDPKIAARIVSRCAEMFHIVDTSDTEDYRKKEGACRREDLLRLIQARKKS